MNNPAEVREYLFDLQKRTLPNLVPRELKVAKSKKIVSVIGPRRAGKTYFMYQKMKELMDLGVRRENILYLNFEDPRLVGTSFKEIREIIKMHWQLSPSSAEGEFYVFLDEPQNVNGWELSARALHDEGFNVFLTGSSSKLLSKEIATSLRGRTIAYRLLPFSFREFLRARALSLDAGRLGSKEKSVLLGALDEYLDFGGFPEVFYESDKETKTRIISEYFNLVVYRDIVERHGIKNTQLIKWLIKSLAASFSKEFSIHKIYLTLKSQGLRVSKNTLYAYVSMLEDSLFAFLVPKFNYSARERGFSIAKAYLCDVGFAKISAVSKDVGRKMENVVFLELERRRAPLSEISYWKNPQQEEVDFVVRTAGGVEQLIQVCRDVADADARKRETRALLKAGKELKCKNLLVISENYEAEQRADGRKIKFVPLWKWLMARG